MPVITSLFPAWLLRPMVTSRFTPHHIKLLAGISDTLHVSSKAIWDKKKVLTGAGDQYMIDQIGEGKDIMSSLCEFSLDY